MTYDQVYSAWQRAEKRIKQLEKELKKYKNIKLKKEKKNGSGNE